MNTEIDFTKLPRPQVIEETDFETLFERRKNRLIQLCPEDARAAVVL